MRAVVLALAATLSAPAANARSGSGHSASYCASCARDSHGHIAQVVDHIVPLKRGGADAPSNMQWQTKADARAKDKWE